MFDIPRCRCRPDVRHEKHGESVRHPRVRVYRDDPGHEHRKCTLNKTCNGRGSTHRGDESIASTQMAYRASTRLHVATLWESRLASLPERCGQTILRPAAPPGSSPPLKSSSVVTSPATVCEVTISRSSRRMILPLRVFGSASVKRISSGRANAPISCATHCRSSLAEFRRDRRLALLQRHEAAHRLSRDLMRLAHHRRLRHRRMLHQRGFHFHGAQPVAADVHHVVHAAQNPVIAVVIAARRIAGEVRARDAAPVLLLDSAPDRPRCCGSCWATAAG